MKFNLTIVYTIILFIGYGIIQFVPTGNASIPIPVPYGEIPPNYAIYWFNLSLSTLLDIILAPPFMIIMFYVIYKSIIAERGPDYSDPSQRKIEIVRNVLIWSGVVLVAGILTHAIANAFNGILGNPVPPLDTVPSTDTVQIAIYWFDEVLGHKLIHFGVFAFLIGCMVMQYWFRRDSQLPKFQVITTYFWASAIGVVYCLAAAEGQAGFDLMVISAVLIGIILYYIKFRGLKLKENALTQFLLIFFASILITGIVFGIISGWLPGYPFLQQPTFT